MGVDIVSYQPHWTREPSIDIAKVRVVRHLDLGYEAIVLTVFAEGALNKLYAVDCSKGHFIFRVSLPVAPSVKTQSEIATVTFVRKNTTIPVPRMLAHGANLRNELGFEWILMERVEAHPLHDVWHAMSWLKKGLLVMQTVDLIAQLLRREMPNNGSPYLISSGQDAAITSPKPFTIGETVPPPFFKDTKIKLDIPRGPLPPVQTKSPRTSPSRNTSPTASTSPTKTTQSTTQTSNPSSQVSKQSYLFSSQPQQTTTPSSAIATSPPQTSSSHPPAHSSASVTGNASPHSPCSKHANFRSSSKALSGMRHLNTWTSLTIFITRTWRSMKRRGCASSFWRKRGAWNQDGWRCMRVNR
jgi:hypothetical protein